jgi:hypothetical protein
MAGTVFKKRVWICSHMKTNPGFEQHLGWEVVLFWKEFRLLVLAVCGGREYWGQVMSALYPTEARTFKGKATNLCAKSHAVDFFSVLS